MDRRSFLKSGAALVVAPVVPVPDKFWGTLFLEANAHLDLRGAVLAIKPTKMIVPHDRFMEAMALTEKQLRPGLEKIFEGAYDNLGR